MSQILGSAGGGFSVIGSMLAAQASVPHQDTALAISLLNLWTQAGGAVGAAIGASIWTNRLPEALNKHLGNDLNSTQIADIYGSIVIARAAEPRDKVIAGSFPSSRAPLFFGIELTISVPRSRSLHLPRCSDPYRRTRRSWLLHLQLLPRREAQRYRGQGDSYPDRGRDG
jgi:hypothetical protein